MSLSVVIPVRNSATTLEALLARLARVLADRDAFEVILVDDGSSDASWPTIEALAGQYAWVRGIRLMRNYGQHNALLCGIRGATRDLIVTMDDDLQHPPEEIPKLLAALGSHDVVYGTPAVLPRGVRGLATRISKIALKRVMGPDAARAVSAFRVFRTHIREGFADCRSPHVSIDVLLAWSTSRFGGVRVAHEPRRHGSSNYSFGALLTHALTIFTASGTLPLRLAGWIGVGLAFVGAVLLTYVLIRSVVVGSRVVGFPFLVSLVALLSGAQLLALGIIGEYVARIHVRLLERPAYAVRDRVGGDS
jgi:glycosyltransferase involved in cell wall biosynthesis